VYKFDDINQTLVGQKVSQFRVQVARRLDGSIMEEHFRQLRLQNGLYHQHHAYMFRVTIPYGLLNSKQLRTMGLIAEKYDCGYSHITTCQKIQYDWVKPENTPDILAVLAKVEIHAIQTSGNCIRNITSDTFSDVAGDENVDLCNTYELIRQ
jgi:sulfite reductase (NADPH) hemoprotein beta-component